MTSALGHALLTKGFTVYSAFQREIPDIYVTDDFMGSIRLSDRTALSVFLAEKRIDVVIIQTKFDAVSIVKDAIEESGCHIKVLFVHHMSPKGEYYHYRFRPYFGILFRNPKQAIKDVIRLLRWPCFYRQMKSRWHKLYADAYRWSDKVILLEEGYREDWKAIVGCKTNEKFAIIPNPVTFDTMFDINKYETVKEKTVLIVSRLCESPKKISTALRIWKSVSVDFPDWKLVIVGDGEDAVRYRCQVEAQKISKVEFEGQQDPLVYYTRASIYLMTSDHEAWSLTLMEAQQTGCVPIAFNTFKALRTVVSNDISGFIVERGDKHEYERKLRLLMSDNSLRLRMAKSGIEHSMEFSKERVFAMWSKLLSKIC